MGRLTRRKINFILFIASFFSCDSSLCKTYFVKEGQGLGKTIALAAPFDTIVVYKSYHAEGNIAITKPLYLLGIDRPVFDGQNKYEIFGVKSSNVTIEGFDLRNGGRSSMNDIAGIKIYLSKHVLIKNNIFHNMFFGIYFLGCSSCRVENNIIESSGSTEIQTGNGIHCWKSDSMTIIGNNVTGQRDGIYFEFVTNSFITKNLSEKNIRYGLHFMFSHYNTYTENIFRNNGAGVAVMYTHGITMLNNTFTENWGSAAYGLLLKDISDSHIEHNTFAGNTIGIHMEGSSRIKILRNTFKGNGYALKIQASCDANTLENNNFLSNTFDVSTNGTLVENIFSNNYWDKYAGYDLNRDGIGDIPHHPISMYSMIAEKIPIAMIFFRSFMVDLMDKVEKEIPSITPENFKDDHPLMKQIKL